MGYREEVRKPTKPQSGARALDELGTLDQIADLMDSRFLIPGTSIRFGVDAIAGLVPGVGDSATALVGVYLIYRAAKLGASKPILARMAANIGIDWAVGAVPFLGDLFDVFFKSHRRNIALLRRHLADQSAEGDLDMDTANSGGRASV